MNWFSTNYDDVLGYSPDWYGIHDYAPPAKILLYDDNNRYCIGYMEEELPEYLTPLTEQEAMSIIENYIDCEGVWFGEKLEHRWDEPESIIEEEIDG